MDEYRIRYFKLENGKEPFMEWFNALDNSIKKRVLARLSRICEGNFGDWKKVDENLCELRLNFGSGYRIYYIVEDNTVIILLSAGDKSTQAKDITNAKEYIKILKG